MTAAAAASRVFRVELVYRHRDYDGEGRHLEGPLREAGFEAAVQAEFRPQYLLEGENLTAAQAQTIANELLVDPPTQTVSVRPASEPAARPDGAAVVVVQLRAGVMDPVAQSVVRGAKDLGIALTAARTVKKFVFRGVTPGANGALPATLAAFTKRQLANDVIEEVLPGDPALTTLRTGSHTEPRRVEISGFRELTADALVALSKQHRLALDVHEMTAIQAHFREAGADPTDVELETIAQTWSEHCKHKTLTGIVDYVERDAAGAEVHRERIDNLLKSTIARATHELMAKDDTANPFCLSVFVDNAGVIAFDETFGVAMKVETHNHPSALEPYGGAGTGIGGVIRDIMGTGLGARPILNTDVFCFGPPQFSRDDLPAGVLHPARVMRGVVAGVRDYGNRMGIPTGNGAIFFHERYLGNPLVYAGCVGIMPRTMIAKAAQDGDAIVVIGGRTGRDGIGGATFSSAELTSESETVSSGAVQIGNAIEEKRVLDVMLQARDRGLFNAVTDCGAGGLSSAVGEMGEQLGAEVQLDRVPLKYDGLTSREIWLSEAQERMVVAISPGDKLDAALALFAGEDVEATVIGTFVASGRLKLRHGDVLVADLDMRFLHDGLPRTVRKAEWQPAAATRSEVPAGNVADTLRKILAAPNVCSKEPVVRQYDHEVLAMSVVKPFVGPGQRGPSDGCVLQPVPGSPRGVVISNGLNPELGLIDPYHMATNAIDEAVRNALACGGSRRTLAILDNYSWGNCNKPDRFGGLVRASKACYELAVTWGLPFISGKDSLNNEYLTAAGEAIAIPPTLLISAIGVMRDVNAQTMTSELKAAGSRLFVLGVTRPELGGSHLLLASGLPSGTDVPQVRPAEAAATFDRLEALRDAGIVRACHDCAEGGLLTAVAEMAIGGGGELGASLDVHALRLADDDASLTPAQRDTVRLFAESPSRFVLEIAAEHADQAASIAGDRLQPIGSVTDAATLTARGETGELMSASVEVLCAAWQGTLRPWFA